MKKILLQAVVLIAAFTGVPSCTSDDEVRTMPEFNYADHAVQLRREAGSSFTALVATTERTVRAEFDCGWLAVDAGTRRVVFTALETNDTGAVRTTEVVLRSGAFTETVVVTQLAIEQAEEGPR